jgi:hypothetical protein
MNIYFCDVTQSQTYIRRPGTRIPQRMAASWKAIFSSKMVQIIARSISVDKDGDVQNGVKKVRYLILLNLKPGGWVLGVYLTLESPICVGLRRHWCQCWRSSWSHCRRIDVRERWPRGWRFWMRIGVWIWSLGASRVAGQFPSVEQWVEYRFISCTHVYSAGTVPAGEKGLLCNTPLYYVYDTCCLKYPTAVHISLLYDIALSDFNDHTATAAFLV